MHSLRTRLAVILVVLAPVPIVGLFFVAYNMAANAIKSEALKTVSLIANAKHNELIAEISKQEANVAKFLFISGRDCRSLSDLNCIQEKLADFAKKEGALAAAVFAQGVALAEVGDSTRAWPRIMQPSNDNSIEIGPVENGVHRSYVVRAGSAEKSQWLIIRYPVEKLRRTLIPRQLALGKSGAIYLLSNEGSLVINSNPSVEPTSQIDSATSQFCQSKVRKEFFSHDNGSIPVIQGIRHVKEIGNGCLVANMHPDEAFARLAPLRKTFAALVVAFLFAALGITFLVAQFFSNEVSLATQQFAKEAKLAMQEDRDLDPKKLPVIDELKALLTQLHEITKQCETERATLKAAELAAREVARIKSEFLSTMSHEIRTPLNVVIGATDLLSFEDKRNSATDKHPYCDKHRQIVGVIRSASDALLAIINDILDLSKIETDKLQLVATNFSLTQLLNEMRSLFSSQAETKGLRFDVTLTPDSPPVMVGDVMRLRQVLINLVGNAFKFTHAGHVSLRASVSNTSEDRANVQIEIEDTGPGIPEHSIQKLFEPFSQLNVGDQPKEGGTGLGLAICKKLVKKMGGEIGVKSSPENGAIFWVNLTLPVGVAETLQTGQIQQMESAVNVFPGLRVLIAEDNRLNQKVIEAMVKKIGAIPTIVEDGATASEILKKEQFDLVLMDILMPRMNGYDAAQSIRASDNSIPIIALTANTFREDIERCMQAGMNDFLPKPVRIHDLSLKIRKWQSKFQPVNLPV